MRRRRDDGDQRFDEMKDDGVPVRLIPLAAYSPESLFLLRMTRAVRDANRDRERSGARSDRNRG